MEKSKLVRGGKAKPGGVPIIEREREMEGYNLGSPAPAKFWKKKRERERERWKERRGEERREERDTSSPVHWPELTLYFLSFSLLSVLSFLK
jgi:hypothetical protein